MTLGRARDYDPSRSASVPLGSYRGRVKSVDRDKVSASWPPQGTLSEADRFRKAQARLAQSFRDGFHDPNAPRTVVIVPSLSLDEQVLARIAGVHHYEERMLCLLLLLRMPRTRVIYLTSTPIPEAIVDYFLHLLPGIPAQHARARLILLSCHDSSSTALSAKLLARPRLLRRVLEAIPDASNAHMTCFNVTELERQLALSLGLPIYGCDPSLLHWGSKSGSRKIFREAGIAMPWYRWLGSAGRPVSLEHFGASADFQTLYREFGITTETVVAAAQDSLAAAGATAPALKNRADETTLENPSTADRPETQDEGK